jgi:uncharacterized DUF497 family protein
MLNACISARNGITVIHALSLRSRKSKALRANPKRGIGFEEAQALFDGDHIFDRRSDDPEQWRAIGWVAGTLYSVIYEVRQDSDGEFYHLVTL